MNLTIHLQNASNEKHIPKKTDFKFWLKNLFLNCKEPAAISIRIVDSEEIQALNHYYRGKNKPTNILSFPFVTPKGVTSDLLGDLVICASIVNQEAKAEHKTFAEHWAHLTIHGALHLLGFTHEANKDAKIMEALEIKYLEQLGFKNPY